MTLSVTLVKRLNNYERFLKNYYYFYKTVRTVSVGPILFYAFGTTTIGQTVMTVFNKETVQLQVCEVTCLRLLPASLAKTEFGCLPRN